MIEIFTKLITLLTTNAALTALIPATNIFTGSVDVTMEKQNELLYPSIVLSQVNEIQRSVPQGARDSQIQIDIWSRNSQLEVENIYEAIINVLSYQSGDSGSAHIFWQRLGGAVDQFENDRRVWHRACTFQVWSMKP
jgi:hypothetical protein